MRTKLFTVTLVLLIAFAAIAYISIVFLNNSRRLLTPSPSPTLPPIPTVPTELNASATGWGDPHLTYPNELTIISPQNLTYQTSSLTLKVNITTTFWVINSVYYKADWLGDYHRIYTLNYLPVIGEHSQAFTLTANFTGIPDGNHTLLVIANYHDSSHASETVNFSVNTSAAK